MVVFRYKEWGLMIYTVDRLEQCLACRPGTSVCWVGSTTAHHQAPVRGKCWLGTELRNLRLFIKFNLFSMAGVSSSG